MNYWWMNTDPGSWNIYKRMREGEKELWTARGENGSYKRYMKWVRPHDRGLCFQTHHASKLVAELKAVSELVKKGGNEGIYFELVRFLKPPVPWFTIEAANIIMSKSIKWIRRPTLFPLTALQHKRLLDLSGASGIITTVTQDLEALKLEENRKEGALKSRHINYYERRADLRAAAIDHHHTVCQVCGFDFEKRYGDRGSGFIEVHHLKPISTLIKATSIDPKKDMAVVCANCHRMIHRKRNHILSLNELRKLLNKY